MKQRKSAGNKRRQLSNRATSNEATDEDTSNRNPEMSNSALKRQDLSTDMVMWDNDIGRGVSTPDPEVMPEGKDN